MRGLVPQEEFHHSTSNILSRITKFIVLKVVEKININNADSISTVSKQFKEHINTRYRLKDQVIEILPNYIDPNQFFFNQDLREQYRRKYQDHQNQKIIIYSGMLQKWQDPELLFSFIKNIQDQANDQEFKFLILTFDLEKAANYADKNGITNILIESAPVDELNGIYNAADIGLAFRDANIASAVSSPVKIPEYLATGLGLISLESIGDFGRELVDKPYTLIRKNREALMRTTIEEIRNLRRPSPTDLKEITDKFSYANNLEALKRIFFNWT
jgi:glycosyltransferase involved in cell wall biosynthesis